MAASSPPPVERGSPLLAVALGTVGLIAASAIAIVMLSPGPSVPVSREEEQVEREYKKLAATVAPLVDQGRLAEAVKAYDDFLKGQERKVPAWARAKEERSDLIKKITALYEKDRRQVSVHVEKGEFREALGVLERMLPYAIEEVLKDVLAERERVLSTFDTQARDYYHKVTGEFRKRMVARDPAAALQWVNERLLTAEGLPAELRPEWLQVPGLDYPALRAAVKDADVARIFELAEPRLLVARTLMGMETSRLILFDLLCAAYALSLRRQYEAGFGYVLRDRHEIRRLKTFQDRGGVPSVRDGKFIVRTQSGEELVLRFETLALEDLRNLAVRGAHSDIVRCKEAAERDPRLLLQLGVLGMFVPAESSMHEALAHFTAASDSRNPARNPLADLFLQVYQVRVTGGR